MTTKKELESELDSLQNKLWDKNREIREKDDKIEKLESNLKFHERESKNKSQILKQVTQILAGDSPDEAKAKVLFDLFPEAKELKEQKNERRLNDGMYRMRF